jgi:predicted DNA binding CopG/RHH family protein
MKGQNENQEQEFRSTHDFSEYIDWSKSDKMTFPNLKPSTKTISLRLPEMMIEDLKSLEKQRNVPYQSLIKCIFPNVLCWKSIT